MSGPTKNVTHHGTNTLPAVNQRCVIQVPRCMPLTGPSVRMASLRMACCVSAIGCVLCTPRLCESSPRADTLPGHISTGIDLGKPCLNPRWQRLLSWMRAHHFIHSRRWSSCSFSPYYGSLRPPQTRYRLARLS